MPTITLKNVPETLHRRLKERAERNRRSLNEEAVVCLEQALSEEMPAADMIEDVRELRNTLGLRRRLTAKEVQEAIGSGRE